MRAQGHKIKQHSGGKGWIALTCLLLFVPQLSYKFYLAANIPTVYARQQLSFLHSHHEDAAQRSFAHDRHHRLRIDKRYDLKQMATLPETAFVVSCPSSFQLCVFDRAGSLLLNSFLHQRPVRGPPVFSSFWV